MAKGNGNGQESADAAVLPQLSKEQKLALFESYDKAQSKVKEAQSKVDEAIKKICDACGQGPFKWKGQELTLVKKKNSDGVTFRSRGATAEEIG